MARSHARIVVTPEEESTLRDWARKGKAERRVVDRARIILWSHEGVPVAKIAERLHTRPARVSKWRQRFMTSRLEALSDGERSGKPCTYTEETEKRVLKLLDEKPPEGYVQWNDRLLSKALGDVSDDQVWRVLRSTRSSWRDDAVGASAQTWSLGPRPLTLSAST